MRVTAIRSFLTICGSLSTAGRSRIFVPSLSYVEVYRLQEGVGYSFLPRFITRKYNSRRDEECYIRAPNSTLAKVRSLN